MSGQKTWYFHTGHTADLIGVSKKTIYRWRNVGKINFQQDGMSKEYLFTLDEINRIRLIKFMPPLTSDEAVAKIKENYSDLTHSG